MDQDNIYNSKLMELGLTIDDIIEKHTSFDPGHSHLTKAYSFSTEDLSGIDSPLISYSSKKVLGVIASGDHIFLSLLRGAEEYVGFDISLIACFYSELKKSAIDNLTHQEFIQFFGKENTNLPEEFDMKHDLKERKKDQGQFSVQTYQGIRDNLSETSKSFFDKIIHKSFDFFGVEVPYLCSFLARNLTKEDMVSYVSYLSSEENYLKTRDAIRERPVSFIPSPIEEGNKNILVRDKCFDIIYLTSVLHYFPDNEERLKVLSSYLNNLVEGGIIIGDYSIKPLLNGTQFQKDFIFCETAHRRFQVKDRLSRITAD
jgi:hypothetical protein